MWFLFVLNTDRHVCCSSSCCYFLFNHGWLCLLDCFACVCSVLLDGIFAYLYSVSGVCWTVFWCVCAVFCLLDCILSCLYSVCSVCWTVFWVVFTVSALFVGLYFELSLQCRLCLLDCIMICLYSVGSVCWIVSWHVCTVSIFWIVFWWICTVLCFLNSILLCLYCVLFVGLYFVVCI